MPEVRFDYELYIRCTAEEVVALFRVLAPPFVPETPVFHTVVWSGDSHRGRDYRRRSRDYRRLDPLLRQIVSDPLNAFEVEVQHDWAATPALRVGSSRATLGRSEFFRLFNPPEPSDGEPLHPAETAGAPGDAGASERTYPFHFTFSVRGQSDSAVEELDLWAPVPARALARLVRGEGPAVGCGGLAFVSTPDAEEFKELIEANQKKPTMRNAYALQAFYDRINILKNVVLNGCPDFETPRYESVDEQDRGLLGNRFYSLHPVMFGRVDLCRRMAARFQGRVALEKVPAATPDGAFGVLVVPRDLIANPRSRETAGDSLVPQKPPTPRPALY